MSDTTPEAEAAVDSQMRFDLNHIDEADKQEEEALAFFKRKEDIDKQLQQLRVDLIARYPVIYVVKEKKTGPDQKSTLIGFHMTRKCAEDRAQGHKTRKVKAVACEELTVDQILDALDDFVD